MPIIEHEFKMVTCSDAVSYFRSRHVGWAHDCNEHVEHMNDHHECRDAKSE